MLYLFIISFFSILQNDNERIISYGGQEFKTTFDVEAAFLGTYEGRKAGFLKLNADGTGEYKYDILGFAPASCDRKSITFIWGFIIDKEGEITKNKRDYGYSLPILLQSTGSNSFQGCRTEVLRDYILIKGKTMHVSSSDDWQKTK